MSNILVNKVEGDTLQALEWNQLAEINNLITSSGQSLDANVLEQVAKAVANYVNSGNFYTENGVANSYTLIGTGSFKTPTAYRDGMVIRFITTNANTTTTPIINLAGLGAKNILKADGTAVVAGDISGYVELRYNGTDFLLNKKNPSIQKFTSGSGTYTLPTDCKYIRVKMVGAGGGGAGSGSGASGGNGGAGSATTFGTSLLVANGGIGGFTNGNLGSVGGAVSLGTGPIGTALQGGSGTGGYTTNVTGAYAQGGAGGSSAFGGAGSGAGGSGGGAGGSAIVNTGGGGGGAGGTATTTFGGAGGGGGGYVDAIISSPSATYSYSIGTGGAGGTAGTVGFAGGAGGSGYIEVTEFYN